MQATQPNLINRREIIPGHTAAVVSFRDSSRAYVSTVGIVQDILTKSQTHPYGIKVRLQDGTIGRIKAVLWNLAIPAPNKVEPMTEPCQWEILSKTSNGELVVVCTTEATSAEDAKAKTAKFCGAYDITVAAVRKAS